VRRGADGVATGGAGLALPPASSSQGVLALLWSAMVKAPHQSASLPAPYAVPFDGALMSKSVGSSGAGHGDGGASVCGGASGGGGEDGGDGGGASGDGGAGSGSGGSGNGTAAIRDDHSSSGSSSIAVGWPAHPPPPLGRTSLRLASELARAERAEAKRRRRSAAASSGSSNDSGNSSSNGSGGLSGEGGGEDDGDGSSDEEGSSNGSSNGSSGGKQRQPQSQWARCSCCGAFVARGVGPIADHIASCEAGGAVGAYQGRCGP
jgi:hypothetical protein